MPHTKPDIQSLSRSQSPSFKSHGFSGVQHASLPPRMSGWSALHCTNGVVVVLVLIVVVFVTVVVVVLVVVVVSGH